MGNSLLGLGARGRQSEVGARWAASSILVEVDDQAHVLLNCIVRYERYEEKEQRKEKE
jgi:hypothetical protein